MSLVVDERSDDIAEAIAQARPVDDEMALQAEVDRLAALSPLAYDRDRQESAEALGVRVSVLDQEVKKRRKLSDGSALPGSDFFLKDVEPCTEPVNGNLLLLELVDVVRRHVVVPNGGAETIALWIMHTHLHATASISPILAITSPSPACGKTTLLELLGGLVQRPMTTSNITTASVFRAVEKWQPSLLIDEGDTFIRDSDDLRGILNSGHRKSAAYVIRTVGDNHEPRQFRTWAPKAIALIGKLPDTLASRSIEISLRRKTASDLIEELRTDRLQHLEPLRRRCARWALDVAASIEVADPDLPPTLQSRVADNWRHLIAIGDAAGEGWPQRVRRIAEAAAAGATERTPSIILLNDIRQLFADSDASRLMSKEIVQALAQFEDRPWSEWRNGNPITPRQLAKLLEPFDIAPARLREKGYTPGARGYERASFEDAFLRYLPSPAAISATPPQPSVSAVSTALDPPRMVQAVADQVSSKLAERLVCGVVADQAPTSTERWTADDDEVLFQERAAIREFDGGFARLEAERLAQDDLKDLAIARPIRTGGSNG